MIHAALPLFLTATFGASVLTLGWIEGVTEAPASPEGCAAPLAAPAKTFAAGALFSAAALAGLAFVRSRARVAMDG